MRGRERVNVARGGVELKLLQCLDGKIEMGPGDLKPSEGHL